MIIANQRYKSRTVLIILLLAIIYLYGIFNIIYATDLDGDDMSIQKNTNWLDIKDKQKRQFVRDHSNTGGKQKHKPLVEKNEGIASLSRVVSVHLNEDIVRGKQALEMSSTEFETIRSESDYMTKSYSQSNLTNKLKSEKGSKSPNFSEDVPSAIMIGTQKGGTEALQVYLSTHPNIKFSTKYEPHFFDWCYHFFDWCNPSIEYPNGTVLEEHRAQYLEEYQNFAFNMTYLKSRPNMVTIEKTPSYMFDIKVPYRIKSILPRVKLIILLCNPVERAYSNYKMSMDRDEEKHLTFEQCVDQNVRLLRKCGVDMDEHHGVAKTSIDWDDVDIAWVKYMKHVRRERSDFCDSIIGRSVYVAQLRVWWRVYNATERRDQILVIKSEYLLPKEDGLIQLKNITRFIGLLDMEEVNGTEKIHASSNHPPMKFETRRRLRRLFSPFNDGLKDMLGPNWIDPW